MKRILLHILFFLAAIACNSAAELTNQTQIETSSAENHNPVMNGADPDVLLEKDIVWMYPTAGPQGQFYAFSSKDLVTWQRHGPILDFSSIKWIPADKHAWAPGIIKKNGKYYLYYSVGPKPSHIGVASSDSPAGPFTDSGRALLSDNNDPNFEAIDAMAFTDPQSKKTYLYTGGSVGSTLRVFELNDDMVSFAREIPVQTPPSFTEGSFMHYRDGIYYLSYSHGSWNNASYSVHYATSDTPTGPWTYRGVILSGSQRHKGPGHHSFLYNAVMDEWYLFYHRWNNRSGLGPFRGSRKIAIEKMVYETDAQIRPFVLTDKGVGPITLGDSVKKNGDDKSNSR
ncbi:MAG: family 43 glycosylhydrolase [Anaerohalosphaeraceae bacterium]